MQLLKIKLTLEMSPPWPREFHLYPVFRRINLRYFEILYLEIRSSLGLGYIVMQTKPYSRLIFHSTSNYCSKLES